MERERTRGETGGWGDGEDEWGDGDCGEGEDERGDRELWRRTRRETGVGERERMRG